MTLLPLLLLGLTRQSPFQAISERRPPGDYKIQPPSIEVRYKGKPVARYMIEYDTSTPQKREETYKPYLHIIDPDTGKPITKGPGGEFPHHRGIFLGWNKLTIDGKVYDRWHMKGGEQIASQKIPPQLSSSQLTVSSFVFWTGEGGLKDIVLNEERCLAFSPPPTGAFVQVDFISDLSSANSEQKSILLDGDPEHAGLHFRPTDATDRANTVYLYPKANANAHKDRDYPWVGMTYTAEGQKYSVVMLSHSENPTDTAWSAYRNYGRFGAFYKTAIKQNETLRIQARFVVYKGELPSPEAIQALWNGYTGKKEPLIASTRKPAEQPAPKK